MTAVIDGGRSVLINALRSTAGGSGVPPEMSGKPFIALQLPLPVALGVVQQSLDVIVAQSPFPDAPQWLKTHLKTLQDFFTSTMPSQPPGGEPNAFKLEEAEVLADDLRCLYHNPGLRFTDQAKGVLHCWIHKLH